MYPFSRFKSKRCPAVTLSISYLHYISVQFCQVDNGKEQIGYETGNWNKNWCHQLQCICNAGQLKVKGWFDDSWLMSASCRPAERAEQLSNSDESVPPLLQSGLLARVISRNHRVDGLMPHSNSFCQLHVNSGHAKEL